MTGRDRLVLIGVLMLVVLAGGWLLLVSPERKQAAQAQTKIEGARTELQTAQAEAASERSAEARYASAYVSVVRLGKAVPPLQEVPSLVYELEHASHQRDIEFNSIAAASSAGSSASSAAAPAGATAAAFTQMPFTFVFKGTFFELARLLGQIDGFARTTTSRTTTSSKDGAAGATAADKGGSTPTGVQVSGRLLTIQGVSLAIESKGTGTGAGSAGGRELSATITATAYVLPSSQGLSAGATAAGPAGSAAASASAAAAPTSSPTSPAVIRGAP